jgi:hypothetical protein
MLYNHSLTSTLFQLEVVSNTTMDFNTSCVGPTSFMIILALSLSALAGRTTEISSHLMKSNFERNLPTSGNDSRGNFRMPYRGTSASQRSSQRYWRACCTGIVDRSVLPAEKIAKISMRRGSYASVARFSVFKTTSKLGVSIK